MHFLITKFCKTHSFSSHFMPSCVRGRQAAASLKAFHVRHTNLSQSATGWSTCGGVRERQPLRKSAACKRIDILLWYPSGGVFLIF